MAWTGIASILLIEGRTVHNVFQLPLDLNEDSQSSISLSSSKAQQIKETDVFIWDEAAMAPLYSLKAIDRFLKRLMGNNILFGGKVMVLGGDFRQVTPVIPKACKAKIIENSIKNIVKTKFKTLKLSTNMRADKNEKDFAEWLLKIGNAQVEKFGEDLIQIPNETIVTGDLVEDLYNGVQVKDFKDICCLSTKNQFVSEMNERILSEKIFGEMITKTR